MALLRKIASGFTILVVVSLSFMPYRDKRVLHTKGRLHPWGHLAAFALIAGLCVSTVHTRRARAGVLAFIFALALGIESLEHLRYGQPLEVADIVDDGIGALMGAALAMTVLD